MIFKNEAGQGDLNGFLDRGSHLNGELQFENTFRVDGKLTGKVTSTGSLVVGDGGEVDGEVEVAQVFVSGVVRGSVAAAGRIHVAAGGKVYADLETPSLVIEDGAVFEGRCAMTGKPRGSAASQDGGAKPKLVPQAAES